MSDPGKSSARTPLLVMAALSAGPKHGYEVASYIEERSRGVFAPSFGALYPVLHKLEKDGLVAGTWEGVGAAGAKQRKVYALTARGRRELTAERQRFEAWADAFGRMVGAKV